MTHRDSRCQTPHSNTQAAQAPHSSVLRATQQRGVQQHEQQRGCIQRRDSFVQAAARLLTFPDGSGGRAGFAAVGAALHASRAPPSSPSIPYLLISQSAFRGRRMQYWVEGLRDTPHAASSRAAQPLPTLECAAGAAFFISMRVSISGASNAWLQRWCHATAGLQTAPRDETRRHLAPCCVWVSRCAVPREV